MSFLKNLPSEIIGKSYLAAGEAAWRSLDAIDVIEILTLQRLALVGIEVWLVSEPGPTIPTPYIYTWEPAIETRDEDWDVFVKRANTGGKEYIQSFAWDCNDVENQIKEPYFNLEFCTEEEWATLT